MLNEKGNIIKVPIETFTNLSPKAIIVLTDSAEKIFTRLKQRDDIKHDIRFLECFQTKELKYSQEISKELNIPYYVYSPTEELNGIYHFITKVMQNI